MRSFSPIPPERSLTEMTLTTGVASTNLANSTTKTGGGGGGGLEDGSKTTLVIGGVVLSHATLTGAKNELVRDSVNHSFMDDVSITSHLGEPIIRARCKDYVSRFVRVAYRWGEDHLGTSSISPNTKPIAFQRVCI
ncbi:uncharacterized protein MELLADRAFT_108297 [Melampsora larici-populina 98AG31]|uniref:Uncharacterized protein n=1 Tax=Melampsora larici-populina (strain 98AG31 / pathotype 3-4-7) TaxID=747676 RepID=F4RSM3_MELLP|nr:uncharacterized protein MELLADRAFT_108297 [Melampsora larici-populina 98AG31]EGG04623.1 hypothetical protein MELLADRAFT_108297 [Melampsora larici-populina 98AG31]